MGQTGRRSIATYILAVKIALGRLHFHGFGVARQGPWVTSVNYARICSRALQANRPDAGIECVGYVENSRIVVEVHIPRLVEPHFGRRPLLAVETHLARAGHSRDRAVFVHLADPVVLRISDVHVAFVIECKGVSLEPRLNSGAAIAREAVLSGASEGGDGPMGIHLPNGVAAGSVAIERGV